MPKNGFFPPKDPLVDKITNFDPSNDDALYTKYQKEYIFFLSIFTVQNSDCIDSRM